MTADVLSAKGAAIIQSLGHRPGNNVHSNILSAESGIHSGTDGEPER